MIIRHERQNAWYCNSYSRRLTTSNVGGIAKVRKTIKKSNNYFIVNLKETRLHNMAYGHMKEEETSVLSAMYNLWTSVGSFYLQHT